MKNREFIIKTIKKHARNLASGEIVSEQELKDIREALFYLKVVEQESYFSNRRVV